MPKRRNISIMCCIALLQGMVFYAPIASLYRQAAGLTLAQIALIEGISYLFALAMELPWGMLADRIGYRRTMIVSCAIYALSKLVFWQAEDFAAFLLERFILSAALAGLSGVEESILHLSCPEGENQRVFGLHNACSTAGQLLAAGMYALWIGKHYRSAALSTMIAYTMAAALSLGISEVHMPERNKGCRQGLLTQVRILLRDWRFWPVLIGFALFRECIQMATVWLSQNQYLRCGMNTAGLGAASIAMTIAALPGIFSKRMTDHLGRRRFALPCFAAAALSLMTMALTRSAALSVICVCMAALCRAWMEPLFASVCSNRIGDHGRATMLSLFALVQSFAAAAANTTLGSIADISLDGALWICGGICLACGIAVFTGRKPFSCA